MGKSIVRKKSIDIKGILNLADKEILIECEDSDEPYNLSDLIKSFNSCEATISVRESVDIA